MFIVFLLFVLYFLWVWIFQTGMNFVFPDLALSYWQAFVLWLIIATIANVARRKQ